GDAPGLDMPVGDHVVAPQQHTVQRPGVGDQLLARVGVDKAFDDLVDGWVLQADEVAAARIVGTGGVPVLALFVARRVGLAEAADDHVEITRAQAVDVLRNVDTANHHLDTEISQISLEWQQNTLELGLCQQEFEAHRLAIDVEHAITLDAPAGLLQQLIGAALLLADDAAAIGDRYAEFFVEHFGRNLAAQWFEDSQLVLTGQSARAQFGVVEVAAGAEVGAVEQALVGPLEIVQQAQGFAHAAILKLRAAGVEDEALHAGGIAVQDFFLDQLTVGDCRGVVGGRPVLRAGFQPVVEMPGLQRFQGHGVVA